MNHTKKWRTKARNSLWTTRFWDCIKISFRVLQKFYANDLTPNCPVMSHPCWMNPFHSWQERPMYIFVDLCQLGITTGQILWPLLIWDFVIPYSGRDISVNGKMKSLAIIFLSAATAAVMGSNPCLNNEEIYFPDPEGGWNFHRLTFHDFSCRLQLVLWVCPWVSGWPHQVSRWTSLEQ